MYVLWTGGTASSQMHPLGMRDRTDRILVKQHGIKLPLDVDDPSAISAAAASEDGQTLWIVGEQALVVYRPRLDAEETAVAVKQEQFF